LLISSEVKDLISFAGLPPIMEYLGKEIQAFEQEFAAYSGVKHCIGVANGLDALRLIFQAYMELGVLQEGD